MNDYLDAARNRLLVVDDEPSFCEFVSTVAENIGFEVRTVLTNDEFLPCLRAFDPTGVVLDLNMPDTDGIELLRTLTNEKYTGLIIVISGEDDRVLGAAQRLGTTHGLNMATAMQKPVLLPDLKDALEHVMRQTIQARDLVDAIETGDLLVRYQPQLRNTDGSWLPVGAEALVRWVHPQLGMVMPNEFIPVAEEAGVISQMTDFVLQQVVEQLSVWRRQDFQPHISVNVGAHLLTDVEFPDRLVELLNRYDLSGSELTLEVTEGSVIEDLENSMDIFARLRLRGVGLALDDFGTGYSTLRQLFNMPFDELKLDGSFVREVVKSAEARTIVRTMIQLAHNLKMIACAEYVENQEVLDFLVSEDCDKAQGFYFSEAVSAADFENFYSRSTDTINASRSVAKR